MTLQPDKLFRDKLENFQHPAPIRAWNKVESNLAKRTQKTVWLRIAASIVLLIAAVTLLWPYQKAEKTIAQHNEIQPDNQPQSIRSNGVVKDSAQNRTIQEPTVVLKTKSKSINSHKKEFTQEDHKTATPDSEILRESEVETAIIQPPVSILKKEEEYISKTIVYTADDVNKRFLKKKSPPEATTERNDASGLQKLIGLAYAAKNSEVGLGELREKKDEILALSFKSKRGEN